MNFLSINFSWQDAMTISAFVASIVALIVSWRAYQLQKKSDKDLNRIENNINKMEDSIDRIDESVNQMEHNISLINMEVEKNRLAFYLPREYQMDMHKIFYENQYTFQEKDDEDDKLLVGRFTVRFIKESNGLPKMFYPFERTGHFPYFCVEVIKKRLDYRGEIQLNTYYYLSYSYRKKSWYIAENYPIDSPTAQKIFKVIFSGTFVSGKRPPPASEFCKDC